MKLGFVIPALNEQDSIVSIIERSLESRAHIIAATPVTEVSITVVSDGSTDRTVDLARPFEDRISLVVFEKNRGYGAAIMEGWRRSDADLLGFLDADGTCDPRFFADLVNQLVRENADIALGCRLNRASRMPLLRRVGNTLFAWMLSVFSMSRVRDTASGMRVVRRSCLRRLMPLPTGLHFTPAMSARAMLARDLKIAEIDMPYHERAGESKLNPVRDGIRFLRIILETAFLHRPSRPLGVIASLLLALVALMMIGPTLHYIEHRTVLEWMIYRFLVGELLFSLAVLLMCGSYLGRKAADIALADDPVGSRYLGVSGWFFSRRWFFAVPAALLAAGIAFVEEAMRQYITTGHVTEHWSRFVAMMFFFALAGVLMVTKILDYCLNLLAGRIAYLRSSISATDAW